MYVPNGDAEGFDAGPSGNRQVLLRSTSALIEDIARADPARWTRPTPLLPLCPGCCAPVPPADPLSHWSDHAASCRDCAAALRLGRHGDAGAWRPLPGYPGYEGTPAGQVRSMGPVNGRRVMVGRMLPDVGRAYLLTRADGTREYVREAEVAELVKEAGG
jgi:hypothetical protein